jgi:hypothetical protein
MAQRNIEILIGRLVTDEAFRSAFRANPTVTLTEFIGSGHELTSVETAALGATPADLWEQAAARINSRLQKVSFGEASQSWAHKLAEGAEPPVSADPSAPGDEGRTVSSSLNQTPRGAVMATFEVSAHMTVRPGQLEGFKKQAAECIRITKEKDTHTLRYDWFLSSDGTECEVREAYTGPEGLIEHNRNILEARTKLFNDYADNHFMTFYGEPDAQLLDLVKAHLHHQFKWFSFVKGLD